jgi:2-methylcitrate dehydratase
MQKLEAYEDPQYTKDYPESYRFRIEVTLKSGEKLVKEVRYGKGHPKNPLTDEDINNKFRKLSKIVLLPKRIEIALDMMWHLEDVKSINELVQQFEI